MTRFNQNNLYLLIFSISLCLSGLTEATPPPSEASESEADATNVGESTPSDFEFITPWEFRQLPIEERHKVETELFRQLRKKYGDNFKIQPPSESARTIKSVMEYSERSQLIPKTPIGKILQDMDPIIMKRAYIHQIADSVLAKSRITNSSRLYGDLMADATQSGESLSTEDFAAKIDDLTKALKRPEEGLTGVESLEAVRLNLTIGTVMRILTADLTRIKTLSSEIELAETQGRDANALLGERNVLLEKSGKYFALMQSAKDWTAFEQFAEEDTEIAAIYKASDFSSILRAADNDAEHAVGGPTNQR